MGELGSYFRRKLPRGTWKNHLSSFELAGDKMSPNSNILIELEKDTVVQFQDDFRKRFIVLPLGFREYKPTEYKKFVRTDVCPLVMFVLILDKKDQVQPFYGMLNLSIGEIPKLMQMNYHIAQGGSLTFDILSIGEVTNRLQPVWTNRVRSEYESICNLNKDGDHFAFVTTCNRKTSIITAVTIARDSEPAILSATEHAALTAFCRLYSLVVINLDFYPFTQPIENPQETMRIVKSIKNKKITDWCSDYVDEMLVHENEDVRRLAAYYIKGDSDDRNS